MAMSAAEIAARTRAKHNMPVPEREPIMEGPRVAPGGGTPEGKALYEMVKPFIGMPSDGVIKAYVDDAVQRFTPKITEVVILDREGERKLDAKVHKSFAQALKLVQLQPFTKRGLFLIGPAGSFKTTAMEQIAQALNLKPCIIAVGPQTSKSDLVGFVNAHGQPVWTAIREAHEKGGLVGLDEIDAGNPGVLTIMNSMLSQSTYTWPDGSTTVKHADFRFVAAGNTYGTGANLQYIGRNALDAATLDRFSPMVWDYDEELERYLAIHAAESVKEGTRALAIKWHTRIVNVRRGADKAGIRLVLSPRSSMSGAAQLAAGIPFEEVEQMEIWRSGAVKKDDRERILSHTLT